MPYLTKKTLSDLLSAHKSYCEQNETFSPVTLTDREKQNFYFRKAMVMSRYLETCKNADFYWFNQNAPKAKAYADLYNRLKNLEELGDCVGYLIKRHETPKAPNQFAKRGKPAKIKGKRLELLKSILERKANGEGNAKQLTNKQLCKAFEICMATLYKIRNGKGVYNDS